MDRVVVLKVKHGGNSMSFPYKWFISPEAAKSTVQHTTP